MFVPLRILLVEDHHDTRQTIARLLFRRGFHIHEEETCRGAEEAVERMEFDVLISDISLPDGDGYRLVRRILEKRPSLVAIAQSGYCSGQDLQRCREAGFLHHLCKPYTIDSLEAVVNQAVSRTRGRLHEAP